MPEKLKSIREVKSLDQSGRDAKRGFAYQDHVGAKLCLEMLLEPSIIEVWVEKEDDLTIIRSIYDEEVLEFCQVKHTEEKGSRWSIADICRRENLAGGHSKSFVEKSLEQDRCEEGATFRVISSYPVTQELKCLMAKLGTPDRINSRKEFAELTDVITKKIGPFESSKGTKIQDWIDKCYWQKLPDTISDLRNSNILILEGIFSSKSISLLPQHRDELYQSIVYNASSCDLRENTNGFKIIYEEFLNWVTDKAKDLHTPVSKDKLKEKILHAGGDMAMVRSAKELKYKFIKERLNNDYVRPSNLTIFESAILEKLHDLKIELFSNEINMNGMQFLNLCNSEVQKLSKTLSTSDNVAASAIGKGIMYDLTSKCIHRFTKEVQ
jgi:hypothetical protein